MMNMPLTHTARLIGAALLIALLGVQSLSVDGPGSLMLYLAGWIIVLHVGIGEYVFIRYLHAVSRDQQALDLMAGILLLCGLLSFKDTALWCAFLCGVFALATTKYLLVDGVTEHPVLRQYVREKLLLESPSILVFAGFALACHARPRPDGIIAEAALLTLSAGFAVWMIVIRRVYGLVIRTGRSPA